MCNQAHLIKIDSGSHVPQSHWTGSPHKNSESQSIREVIALVHIVISEHGKVVYLGYYDGNESVC